MPEESEDIEKKKLIELVMQRGDVALLDTKECLIWRSERFNKCSKCPSYLGCQKVIALYRVKMRIEIYEEEGCSCCLDTLQLKEFYEKIFSARSKKELDEISLNLVSQFLR